MKSFVIFILLALVFSGCSDDNSATDRDKILIDNAALLVDKEQLINDYLAYNQRMLEDFDIDFRVLTTNSDEDLNAFANTVFNRLQEDSYSHSGKAILLIINSKQDKVRIEISMALEPVYTDIFVSYLEHNGLLPYFRAGKVADAVFVAAELVRDRAYEADRGQEFMPPMESRSMGGGAKTSARIGQHDPDAKRGEMVQAPVDADPEMVMAIYLQELEKHNKNPDLEIFTTATQKFFRQWTVTDINQDNEYRIVSSCNDKKIVYSDDQQYAVLSSPVAQRTCAPYFFTRENGQWRLDIATMAKTVRFNADMQWHFSLPDKQQYGQAYAFAFNDLSFDKNGYPHRQKKKLRWGFSCGGWYRPGEDPEKLTRCWINNLHQDGAALNALGLKVYDKILAAGSDSEQVNNISLQQFMNYMSSVAKGEEITVIVAREESDKVELHAIAP